MNGVYELCSFSNLSVTSPTSQLILQPFFRFSYVTGSSRTSPGEPPNAHGCFRTRRSSSPHFALHVRDHLDDCFPQQWIGRGGPTAWPPRSPMDFFYWGYMKEMVYSTPVADLEDLRQRIVAAWATLTPEMLASTWGELEYCLDICRDTIGVHIEIYLWSSETLEIPPPFAVNGILIHNFFLWVIKVSYW